MKLGNRTVSAVISDLKYKVNVNSLEHEAGKTLELNEVAVCNLTVDQKVAFDSYKSSHETGAFVLIDRITNNTVAAGMIDYALRRSSNIVWQEMDINKASRAGQKVSLPACCGSPVFRARANPQSLTLSKRSCSLQAIIPMCWMGIMSVTD